MKIAVLNKYFNNFLVKNLFIMKLVPLITVFVFISCEDSDNIFVTEKVVTANNAKFELTLKIDPDIAYLNSSTKVTATLTRLIPSDSLIDYVSMKMIMDAVGGTLDGHSFSIPSSITVSMKDSINSKFEALAFFSPSYSYSSTSDTYYNYKSNGHISASFDGMNLSLPIKMVVPR